VHYFLKIFLSDLLFMKTRFYLSFFFLFLALFLILALAGTGEAFVPKTPHLLHLVITKIKQPVGIEAYQTKKILNYDDITKNGYVELKERLIYLYPGKFRSDIISDTMTGLSVESDFKFIKVMDNVVMSRDKELVDLYTDILLYRNYETLLNQLTLAGIDTTKVSFQRYKDNICYVIGRPLEKERSFSGLWIEKDTFLPVKYVVIKKYSGLMVEFFYNNWQQVSRTWYPMQITVFLDNQLYAMIEVERFDLMSGFSSSLFDIEYIEQLYPKPYE